MEFLNSTYLGNTVGAWLAAALTTALTLLLLRLARRLVIRRFTAVAAQTANRLDDLVTLLVAKTKPLILVVLAIYAGSRPLRMPDGVATILERTAMIALLVQIAIWASHAITFVITRAMEPRLKDDAAGATTIRFLGFLGRLSVWVVIFLAVLDNLGYNITTLITGLGIGGVAVALAVQNILGDLFASLSIMLDKPFVIGDFIVVDGLSGTVEHIGLKTTRLRSLSGEQLVFANADLLKSRIHNYKRMRERRVVFSIGVTYDTPPEKLAGIPAMIREVIEARELTRFDRAHFCAFGDSALSFEVVYYVLDPDYNLYMDIQQAINLELVRRFAAEGIEFAFPTRTLHVHQVVPAAAGG
ncbi:MAG TPA: mechanosensitive ion channel family protein [Longimicrobiales bacterium]